MSRHPLPAFLLPLCLLSLACSAVQQPTASLNSADIGAVTTDGFTVNFDLGVNNPNAFELPLTDADYALSLGGVRVIDDDVSPGGSIPAGGTGNVVVPVRLSFDSLLKAQRAITESGGDVPYAFEGALGFKSAGGLAALGIPNRIPLRFSGTLPLRRLLADPQVLLNSPAARKLAQRGLESLLSR
jgi:LEA14-like dessication related protein